MKTTIKSIVDQLSYEELIVNYQRVKKIQKKKKKKNPKCYIIYMTKMEYYTLHDYNLVFLL